MNKIKSSWDLESITSKKQLDKIDAELKKISSAAKKFREKWLKRTDYLTSPKVLATALAEYNKWAQDFNTAGSIGYRLWLESSINMTNTKVKADLNKVHQISVDNANKIQFFTLNISKINKGIQKKLLQSSLLLPYKHFLESLFTQGQYTLTDTEEQILNIKSKTSNYNWENMLQTLLSTEVAKVKGKKQVKNFSQIVELINNKDESIRDSAAKAFTAILTKYLYVAEHEFNSILENKFNDDKLRKFSRPDSQRHLSDDISTSTVDMLVKTVSANFKIAKDFYRLKARLLGKKRLKYHERNVEYGNLNYKLDFNKSFELVKNTFTRLDPELGVILESYFKNGQVDVFPKKAKTMGAFCAMGNKKDKTFILLNHANSIQNVLTMAHEAGHGIQFDLTRNTQNALNFSFPMCTAETSSTFFEDFVLQEIEKNVNKKSRLELLMMKLNDDISTIFRQIAFYNFEKEIHLEFRSKGYLSAKEIGKIFKKHMLSYMGKYVEQPKDSENWWVYVSHFRNPFYVYSYAFGLLVSKSLQAEVKKNPKRISDVKKFLSVGGSISPENALRGLGFNINTSAFWNKGIDEIKKSLAEAKELGNQVN